MTSLVPRKRDRQTETHGIVFSNCEIELFLQLLYLRRQAYSGSLHETDFIFFICIHTHTHTFEKSVIVDEPVLDVYQHQKKGVMQ